MKGIAFHPESPYSTLVIGTPRSGKTVFLASLYSRLSVAHPGLGTSFYLKAPDGTKLMAIYHRMEYEKRWPERTTDFDSYLFQLRTNVNAADSPKIEPCDHLAYRFYDIPGQSITDSNTNVDWVERLESLATDSDNLLVLIDGHLVLNALGGKSDASLYSQLDFILPVVQRIPGKPLHFLITKWDLIENEPFSDNPPPSELLERILEKLNSHSGFRSMIGQQTELEIPTRLVPVSAVGRNFATLRNDEMTIDPSAVPEPLRVELPIILVLWDGLRLVRKQVNEHVKNKKSTLGSLKNFKQLLEISERVCDKIPLPSEYALGKLGIGAVISFFREYMERMTIPSREDEVNQLELQEQGLLRVLTEFGNLVENLEAEFPASKLADIKE